MPSFADIMTVAETAKVLGMSPAAVHQLIRKSKIETIPFGNRRFVLKESVIAYWDRNKSKKKHDPTRR